MALKLSARLRTSSFNLLLYDFNSASLLTVTSLFASLFTIAILTIIFILLLSRRGGRSSLVGVALAVGEEGLKGELRGGEEVIEERTAHAHKQRT